MTDLEREAREAAKAHRADTERHYYTDNERCTKQVSFELGYLAAAAPREQEIERLRAELAKVTEQRDAWPKYHGTAVEGLMILHDRKDLQDLAGLRCGDFMANAVPHIVAEIDRLRARVKELEGMVPRWCGVQGLDRLRALGWHVAVANWQDKPPMWLMVPPIPLPEKKA